MSPVPLSRVALVGLAALLAVLPVVARAQQAAAPAASPSVPVGEATIRGRVLDAQTGEPLIANLGLDAAGVASRAARTDDAGRFAIVRVPAGAVTLRVRALGHRQESVALVLRPGQDTTLVFRLAPVAFALARVRTTAAPPERQRFDELPDVGSFTIGGRALGRMPGLVEGDVLRAAATLPGAMSRNDFMAGLNVRGGEADQNLVLLDGIPIYNPFHLGGLFGTFIDESVDRVELQTAAFPASQGGRLSSVLDVQTVQEARQGVHGTGEVSLLSSSVTLGGAMPDARGSWNVAARRTYADVVSAALAPETLPYHFQDAQVRVSTLVPGGGALSFTAYAGLDELTEPADEPPSPDCIGCGADDDSFLFDWGNRLAGLTWTQPLGERTTLVQRLYVSTFATRFEVRDGSGGEEDPDVVVLRNSVVDLGLTGSVARRLAAGTLTLGYDVSRYAIAYREQFDQPISDGPFESPVPTDTTQRQRAVAGALYGDLLWRRGRLLLRPGLRVEAAERVGWMGASPRLSAKLFVRDGLALTAALSRHTQLLHAVRNEDLPVRLFDLWVTSDRRVPPSRATHLVGGVEQWWGSDGWVVRAEGWHKRYRELAEPPTTLDPRVRLDQLLRFDGTSYGADLFLRRLERDRWGGWLSYGYGVSRREREGGAYAPAQDRRHNGNLVLGWQPTRRWNIGGRVAVASGTPFTAVAGTYSRIVYDPATNSWRPRSPHGVDEVDARGDRNAARYPLYYRADIGVERAWFPGKRTSIRPYLQVINVSNRHNTFLYEFQLDEDPPTVKSYSQFPLIPTFGVKVEF